MIKLKKKEFISPADTLRAMKVNQEAVIENSQIPINTVRAMADRLNKDGSPYKFTCTTKGYKGQAVKVIRIS